MKRGEGLVGKLVLLERVREQGAREALAGACDAERLARVAAREAEERRAAAAEELAAVAREATGEGRLQALQLRGRWCEQRRERVEAMDVRLAALEAERGAAVEVRRRIEAEWEAARERRKRLEERREAARRAALRRREEARERELDDLPPVRRP